MVFRGVPLDVKRSGQLGNAAFALALFCVCAVGPLVGVVHPPIVVGVFFCALLALVLHVVDRLWARRRPSFAPLYASLFVVGAALSVVQLLPLPHALRAVIEPATTERVQWVLSALSPEALESFWPSLSTDPAQTGHELIRLCTGLFVFLVLADRCRKRTHRRTVYRALIASGVLVLIISIGHKVAQTDWVWGMFRATGRTPLAGPLVNPNHLARLYGVIALVALGYGFTARGRSERLVSFGVAAVLSAAVFLTLSRGGALAFVGAAGLLALLFTRVPDEPDDKHPVRVGWSLVALPALVFAGLAVAIYLAREGFLAELEMSADTTFETSKTAMYGPALRLLQDHWLLGVSTGGFETAYPGVLNVGELKNRTFSHIENGLLQVFLDHGVIFGAALVALLLFVAQRALSSVSARRDLVPLCALAFMLLGDVFDFFLEIGAGTLLAAALLALVAGRAMEQRRTRRHLPRALWAPALAALVVVCLAAVPAALLHTRWTVDQTLRTPDLPTLTLEQALARRPLDGFIAYRLAADARKRSHPRRALRWANRAMVLWPNLGPAHIEAARALWSVGRYEQALLEYRLAWRAKAFSHQKLIEELSRRTSSLDARLRAVPNDDAGAFSAVCRSFEQAKEHTKALECLDRLLAQHDLADAKTRVVHAALAAGDVDGAEARFQRHFPHQNQTGPVLELQSKIEERQYGLDEAYTRAQARVPAGQAAPFLWWKLYAAQRLRKTADALQIAKALRPLVHHPREQDRLDKAEVSLWHALGNLGEALRVAERWARRSPRDKEALIALLGLEIELDLFARATATLRRAEAVAKDDARLSRLRQSLGERRDESKEERARDLLK